MSEQIQDLKIGESIKFTGHIPQIRQTCTRLENKYKVVKINNETCLVVRVEPDTKGLKELVVTSIQNMDPFENVKINGNIGYIRTIVSQFNKANNRIVKVSKQGNLAVLNEDIMERESITQGEFDAIEIFSTERLATLLSMVVDVMDEELI